MIKDFIHIIISFQLWYFFIPAAFFGQTKKNQNLPEVEIYSHATGNLLRGFELKSDSLRFKLLSSLNLTEYLMRETFLNIRSYGPGMVSSISSQGGHASQFQVLWNGIPINHLMLGQTDASTLPLTLIRNFELMSGQNSLSFGSGAMSGQINLQSFLNPIDSSKFFGISHNINTLRLNQTTLKAGFKNTKLNIFRSIGENRYNYIKENSLVRAYQPINQTGVNAQHYFISKKHFFISDVLFNHSERFIGNYARGIFDMSEKMEDVLFLPSIHHFYSHQNFKTENKIYFNYSKLNYLHSLADIKSLSEIYRGGSIHNLIYSFKRIYLRIKGETHLARIKSNNYAEPKSFHYFNLAQNLGYTLLKKRLIVEFGTRADYYPSGRNLPLTYYTGFYGYANSFLKYYIKYSTAFRHPTANELFWNPGGNPNLKPETSEGAEAGLDININEDKIRFTSNMEYFNRITHNNILWTPGVSGFPTPINIQKVWNRGLLSKSAIYYANENFYISLQSITAYVLSTILKSDFENSDNLIGRQLIYTPRYKFNHSISIGYKESSFCLWHQYIGYRFTTTDNSQWLKPFHLWDISILFPSLKKERKWALETTFLIQNIFNTSYALIAGYPMPGRIYQFQIKINYQTPKNNHL
jgi:iron complex outermembrane receptor protein